MKSISMKWGPWTLSWISSVPLRVFLLGIEECTVEAFLGTGLEVSMVEPCAGPGHLGAVEGLSVYQTDVERSW